MTITQSLKNEIVRPTSGSFAPHYYRFEGYRKEFHINKTRARADGIAALFTLSKPHIYKNDLIAGSLRSLWSDKSKAELDYAKKIVDSYGEPNFFQNVDHYAPNYRTVLRIGVSGMLAEIDESMKVHSGDIERIEYLTSMQITMRAFQNMIKGYAKRAEELCENLDYDIERMKNICKNCSAVAEHEPRSFVEALQLVWLCHMAFSYEGRFAMALGRMDQYLYPFFKKDYEAGLITTDEVTELFENVFMKIYEHRIYIGGDDVVNICIGGTSPDGSSDVNELTYCMLTAVKNCGIPGPNLTARVPEKDNDKFLDECLKVIGTGIGYPSLMNDWVHLAALKKYGYDEADVHDYCMVGCIENFITGMQPPWTDGRFDTPRFFEPLFNRGKGIFNPAPGVDTGDVAEITTMDEFMKRFEAQLRYGAKEYYTIFRNNNTRIARKEYEQPFLSCFCEGTIAKGLDICEGGSKYPSVHGVALMGVGTTCDSLAAIEKVIFIDKEATLSELRDALIADFVGYDELREKLLAAPKYGNNDDFVDKYAVWFVDFLSALFNEYKTPDGGGIYVDMASNTDNVYAGMSIAATPDGRRKGEYLSDAASPTYGKDTKGATYTLSSISKPDYTKVACGAVVNQKFSPSMFSDEKRHKLAALIKVYFQRGGQEIQINATSPEVLKDAMEHPENYRDLVVRVSGFSAYYTSLERNVQKDILSRTQQE
ncbi:MAG: hypothetical protein HFE63_08850 [Clostridiales bacterium]|nr:hypothetical protein [Clostridiales bacterium]